MSNKKTEAIIIHGAENALDCFKTIFERLNKMKKDCFVIFLLSLFTIAFSTQITAQNRKAVSGAEVTGTFRSFYKGKFKGSYNEIKIQALGKSKLKISFDLTYPFEVNGELSANVGQDGGAATIEGDTAIFKDDEFGTCEITLKFSKPGTLEVSHNGEVSACGFGHNVTAAGTYKKVSGAKPKFDSENE